MRYVPVGRKEYANNNSRKWYREIERVIRLQRFCKNGFNTRYIAGET